MSGEKAPKSGMLGSGGAAQAGSAIELRKQILDIEWRMSEPGYVPTAAEEALLAQLRGALQNLQKKK